MGDKHPFLSDEWFAIVEKLVEEHGAETGAHASVLVNLTVTETPFGDERHMHMGNRDGKGHWGIGHLDGADVTLTTAIRITRLPARPAGGGRATARAPRLQPGGSGAVRAAPRGARWGQQRPPTQRESSSFWTVTHLNPIKAILIMEKTGNSLSREKT